MNSIIRNGATYIEMPPHHKQRANNKTGVVGTWEVNGKYKASIRYGNKNYNLGTHETLECARIARETAELKSKDGTFIEWYYENFKIRQNKYGVFGLSFRKGRNIYTLKIKHHGIRHFVGEFDNVEDAAKVREDADNHIKDGTFEEWLKSYRNGKKD